MRGLMVTAAILAAGTFVALPAVAVPFTGTYDVGAASGSQTTPNDATGPWVLTSTDSTFSLLRYLVNEHPDFADVTNLSVAFNSPAQNPSDSANAGGGGGAPRIAISLDSDNDGTSDRAILVHLGTSPNFIDTPTTLNTYANANLINNDAGRYDLSSVGGSNFSDYNTALGLVGSWDVLRFTLILDSFGGNDKTLEVTSISGEFNGTPVPEPATIALFGLGLIGLGVARRRKSA